MKTLLLALTIAAASGCTNLEMAQTECNEIGWVPGSVGYAQCVERGARSRDASEAAMVSAYLASMPVYRAPISCYTTGYLTQCF